MTENNMHTIRLRVNEKVYKNLMWFLSKFSKDELQIIEENTEFVTAQKELTDNLAALEKGKAEFIGLEELEDDLEATIRKYVA
ncbi:MAG: hypothetical protein JWQ14_1245 [Adhaeribacter sp.]|nr:hypothetical protein [Adhaeribacter sp.]